MYYSHPDDGKLASLLKLQGELLPRITEAGVTKATVSIVFDNTDPKQSPVGYEQYDQLTITRQVGVFVILVCCVVRTLFW